MSSAITSSLRHSGRAARQLNSSMRVRAYANSGKPPLSHGGSNRNIIIALVGISLPTLYLWQTRNANTHVKPLPDGHPTAASPNTDPAGKARAAKEQAQERDGKVKYEHPEDRDPEKFKPEFGRLHERKRVDGPPDGRNHQELHDRQRQL
ncbi:hypothetical protein AB5N19_07740 [Seiridium cardinale]